ncbi:MAG: NAD(P)/FAD-dependent oxidoreductase [Bacteroidota bacterium]
MRKYVRSYDVIIIGGGIAACATAITMKNMMPTLKVLVIEQKTRKELSDHHPFTIGETLSPHAANMLKQMGIWENFVAEDFKKSYGTSAAWGSGKANHNEFIYTPFGFGWHLERAAFHRIMIAEARKRRVQFLFETRPDRFEERDVHWRVFANRNGKPTELSGKFIVDASGKNAVFAAGQGARKQVLDQLVGVYRYYELNSEEKQHVEGTYIESDKNGWWYSVLLSDELLVIAYMTDQDIAIDQGLEDPRIFDTLLKNTGYTQTRTEATLALGPPTVVATHSQKLDRVVGEKWLTIGEAAMCYDPLSSLGIYKGLSTNLYAAHAIMAYLQDDKSGLQKYEVLLQEERKNYEEKYLAHYGREKRFRNYPFWRRRVSGITVPMSSDDRASFGNIERTS